MNPFSNIARLPAAPSISRQKANRSVSSQLPARRPAKSKVPDPPDERDAPAGRTGNRPSAPSQQAYRDLRQGMQDTDRGPEANRTYDKLKR